MADAFPKFRAAAVHAASVFLNRDESIEKACRLIQASAEQGADLVAFPETFVPGYPFWIWTHTPTRGAPLYYELFTNSVEVGSDATDRIGAAARKAGVYVVLGISEREGGTLTTPSSTSTGAAPSWAGTANCSPRTWSARSGDAETGQTCRSSTPTSAAWAG